MNDELRMAAITAYMEGQQVIARNFGKKHMVSDLEIVTLCNFAEIGLMSVYSELDGETGELAAQDRKKLIENICKELTSDGGDGLTKLSNMCAAILRSPKFMQYIFFDKAE